MINADHYAFASSQLQYWAFSFVKLNPDVSTQHSLFLLANFIS